MKKVFIFLCLCFGLLEVVTDGGLALVALELAKDMQSKVERRGFPKSMLAELTSATTQLEIYRALQGLCTGPEGPEIQNFLTGTAGVILLRRLPDVGQILNRQEERALRRGYSKLQKDDVYAAKCLKEWGMWPLKRRY
ncbi:hypothetical protein HOM50_00510 [bacterium]|jgi:hypothetical protein|nr:hypothetical protein [bacterium]MBT5014874.1 hypothetical protein [bacterium]